MGGERRGRRGECGSGRRGGLSGGGGGGRGRGETNFSRITNPLFPNGRSREMMKVSTGDAEKGNSC